ncbi:MAG: AI-2E family transporter [Sulfobacillus benefaciens]|jgi:predicted PurR-regulated permease PerM|uniref:AI-2E family transporter n=1 Tax=Sulfobacillus benefaciens TaxID=453960 RepID=A0A2T2XAC0_9FIRM|nr:MAG: AI-2E family transporter [Sulfobacillus benefaciens]
MDGNESPKWASRLAMGRDAVVVILGTGVVLIALWWALSRLGNVVVVLMMAAMFEITLSPLVERLALYWKRPWAVLVVVLGAVVIFVVGGGFLFTVIAGQLAVLVAKFPHNIHTFTQSTPGLMHWLKHLGIQVNILELENRLFSSLGQVSTFLVKQTVTLVTHLIDSVVDGAITIFITVYLLLDANRIQGAMLRLIPHQHREGLLAVEHTLSRVIGGYVRGQIMLSLIVGTAFGFGTWLIGLPFPLVIGVFAAIMELIPLLGPVLGAILPIVLALFNHPLVQVPEVLVLLAAAHLLESQILGPKIIRSQVGVHPVISVIALMIGASLRGILGALFAVPIAGIIVAAWVAGVRVWRERVVLPSQPTPPVE